MAFGDRAVFSDVSFRLLKGEQLSDLLERTEKASLLSMSIVTGKLMPDEGKVEWAKNVHAGYLDQHAVLEKRHDDPRSAEICFDPLLQKETAD